MLLTALLKDSEHSNGTFWAFYWDYLPTHLCSRVSVSPHHILQVSSTIYMRRYLKTYGSTYMGTYIVTYCPLNRFLSHVEL